MASPLTHIIITVFLNTLSVSLIVPFHPQLLTKVFFNNDLTASARMFGWQMSISALLQFISRPLLGLWSDRIQNRRTILLLQGAATCISYSMLACVAYLGELSLNKDTSTGTTTLPLVSNNVLWIMYIVSRVLAGLLSNLVMIALTYIADLSDASNKSSNFGLIGMSGGLAFTFGPALGALSAKFIDDRLYFNFTVAFLCCVASMVYSVLYVVDSLELKNRGNTTTTESVPHNKKQQGFKSLLLASNPLKSFSILFSSGRNLVILSIVTFLFGLGNTGFFSIWINYANHRYKFTSYESGIFLTGIGIGYALVQGLFMKRFVSMTGERRSAILALLGSSLTYFGLAIANQGWMTYAVLPLASFASMTDPLLKGIGSHQVDSTKQGTLQGALGSLLTLSGVISPVLLAYMFSFFTSPDSPIPNFAGAPFYFCSLVVFLSFLIMLVSGEGTTSAAPQHKKKE